MTDNDIYLEEVEKASMWLRRKVRNLKGAIHEFENRQLDATRLVEPAKVDNAHKAFVAAWSDTLAALDEAHKRAVPDNDISTAFVKGLAQ